MLRGTNFQAD